MKKIFFSLLIFGLTTQVYSQITALPETVISINYKYINAVNDQNSAQEVQMLEKEVALYNLKNSELYQDDYDSYYVSFYIPGVDETLRVNGNAYLSTDSNYLELFDSENNPPKACIVITVKEMFLHCAKAIMRSKLWHEDSKINRAELPTMGEILKDQLHTSEPAESHQDMVNRYQKDL